MNYNSPFTVCNVFFMEISLNYQIITFNQCFSCIYLTYVCLNVFCLFLPIVFSLKCATTNYHWGKFGDESAVADLTKAQGESISPETPYAEVII